jgi:hypothetical protein
MNRFLIHGWRTMNPSLSSQLPTNPGPPGPRDASILVTLAPSDRSEVLQEHGFSRPETSAI